MMRGERWVFFTGALLLVVGVTLSLLPRDWIEETFAVDPDAGSGAVEALIDAVPIILGLGLLAVAFGLRARRRSKKRSPGSAQ